MSTSAGWLLFPPGQPYPIVEVIITVALRVMHENDPADIAALLSVDRIVGDKRLHDVHEIWTQTYPSVPVSSAQQARVLADIRTNLTNAFDEAMRLAISAIAASAGGA